MGSELTRLVNHIYHVFVFLLTKIFICFLSSLINLSVACNVLFLIVFFLFI